MKTIASIGDNILIERNITVSSIYELAHFETNRKLLFQLEA